MVHPSPSSLTLSLYWIWVFRRRWIRGARWFARWLCARRHCLLGFCSSKSKHLGVCSSNLFSSSFSLIFDLYFALLWLVQFAFQKGYCGGGWKWVAISVQEWWGVGEEDEIVFGQCEYWKFHLFKLWVVFWVQLVKSLLFIKINLFSVRFLNIDCPILTLAVYILIGFSKVSTILPTQQICD